MIFIENSFYDLVDYVCWSTRLQHGDVERSPLCRRRAACTDVGSVSPARYVRIGSASLSRWRVGADALVRQRAINDGTPAASSNVRQDRLCGSLLAQVVNGLPGSWRLLRGGRTLHEELASRGRQEEDTVDDNRTRRLARPVAVLSAASALLLSSAPATGLDAPFGSGSACASGGCCPQSGAICSLDGHYYMGYYFAEYGPCS
jgi:hypothetical protein